MAKGNRFRDAVAALLRTKYPDAVTEKQIRSKKIDIAFSYRHFGKTVRVGVECKDYEKPLTKDQIKIEIVGDYGPLVEANELDEVLIIGRHSLNSAALEYVDTVRWLQFQTYERLEQELIGLHSYIRKLANEFDSQDVGHYYINSRFEGNDRPAIEIVREWIVDPSGDSLAILGGYGKGKTSLALKIVSEQATKHLSDPSERIPILLKLGKVAHETSLEGLFGKEFTATQYADGFRFETLEHLNKAGRLLIVLDGFDEMKHAMSSTDFYNNFREFNRLRGPESKVLLLGRPNALPTDARELVFRGRRMYGSQLHQDPRYPVWREEEIAFFNEVEIDAFLNAYLPYIIKDSALLSSDFIAQRIAEIKEQIAIDILRRPVQVRIVADLAADPNFDLKGITTYTLYEHFIRQLIERDSEKRSRQLIATADRLKFQRELAWWMWTRGESQGHFNRHEVPFEILQSLPSGGAVDLDTKLNEYIVSTLTEEKEAGILYFAHRSFQEFLVAERLRTVVISPDQHVVLSKALSPDIREFLKEAPNQENVTLQWFETLVACNGPLSLEYLSYFQANQKIREKIKTDQNCEDWSPVEVFTCGFPSNGLSSLSQSARETCRKLAKVISSGKDLSAAMAVICLIKVGAEPEETDEPMEWLEPLAWLAVAAFVRLLKRCSSLREGDSAILVEQRHLGVIEKMIQQTFTKKRELNQREIEIQIDLNPCFEMMTNALTHEGKFLDAEIDSLVKLKEGLVEGAKSSGLDLTSKVIFSATSIASRIRNEDLKKSFSEILIPMRGKDFPIVAKSERQYRSVQHNQDF